MIYDSDDFDTRDLLMTPRQAAWFGLAWVAAIMLVTALFLLCGCSTVTRLVAEPGTAVARERWYEGGHVVREREVRAVNDENPVGSVHVGTDAEGMDAGTSGSRKVEAAVDGAILPWIGGGMVLLGVAAFGAKAYVPWLPTQTPIVLIGCGAMFAALPWVAPQLGVALKGTIWIAAGTGAAIALAYAFGVKLNLNKLKAKGGAA